MTEQGWRDPIEGAGDAERAEREGQGPPLLPLEFGDARVGTARANADAPRPGIEAIA